MGWAERLRSLGAGTLRDADVARRAGVTREAVRRARGVLGLPNPRPRDATRRIVLAAYQRSWADRGIRPTLRELCGTTGLSRSTVYAYQADGTVQPRTGNIGHPKHSEAEIIAVLRASGSVAEAAARLGYTRTYLHGLMGGSRVRGRFGSTSLRDLAPGLPDGRRRTAAK